MDMPPTEYERRHVAFRGANDDRVNRNHLETLVVDTVDVGLYGQIAPDDKFGVPRKVYHDNQELWNDLLSGAVNHGDTITLEQFQLLEWLPACPGRYFTKNAARARAEAEQYWDWTNGEFLPLGKSRMVLGGVGSVRLAPRFVRGGEVSFHCASSNGISHQGVPIIAPLDSSYNILQKIKTNGLWSGSLSGTLWPLPIDKSPLIFDRGIPKYYLFAERFEIGNTPISEPLVTIAITYSSTYNDNSRIVAGMKLNPRKNWCFASFNPAEGISALQETVEWLKYYALRYSEVRTAEDRVPIVGDFDEMYQHFDNPIEFPLSSILLGQHDIRIIDFYGEILNITINQEVTVGDKFENISNATIINRSLIEKSFNKIRTDFDEDTANALKKVAAEIERSGNKDAAENFDSFNEELQKPEPKKSVLRALWEGVTTALPSLLQMADIVTKISKLFSSES
jgi:hypothetical protein